MSNKESSLDPSCWGPATWFMLHSFAMGYPDNPTNEQKAIYKQFYENLQYTLPCVWCRVNFINNISQMPIDSYLDSRLDLSRWVYNLHNMVNDETNVPDSSRPTFDEVYEFYNNFRGDCDNNTLTCGSDNGDKKCKILIKNTLSDANLNNNIYNSYWPLILIIIGLLIAIAIISLKDINKK